MIKVRVKQAAQRRGITKPYQLARRLGDAPGKPSNRHVELARRLWKGGGKKLPQLESIDLVAEALACDLSELLVRTPNKRKRIPAPPNSSSNGHRGRKPSS